MKKIGTLLLLAGLIVGFSASAYAQHYNARQQARADRKATKKQQKAQRKYAKQQKKAQKKMLKIEKKNTHPIRRSSSERDVPALDSQLCEIGMPVLIGSHSQEFLVALEDRMQPDC